ncbi:ABC transporter permease [Streptomyces avermitilis]|uniref:ABC transporter permease n=1 Tax=Streptomyces avermitilis TaxID=33903 RepID=UPI0033DEC633
MTAERGSDSASRPIRRAEDTRGAARDAGARHRPVRAAKGIGGVVGAVCVWEILRATSVLPESNAPSVGAISSALFNEIGEGPLATAAAQTAYAWAVGFATAASIGVLLGTLVGLSQWADAATGPLFNFLRPIPAVALVPVAIVLLGLGLRMQTFLISFASVWPVVFNTRYGVRNVDPLHLDSGRILGLRRLALVRRVVLPGALPAVFTGLRLAASIAVVVTVVSELVASGTGLGHYVDLHQQVGDMPEAYAGIVAAGTTGYLVNAAVLAADRLTVRWRAITVGGDQ